MKGIFITLEGGEGAGKSTLLSGIAAYLHAKGVPFVQTRAPGGTLFGEKVRSLLLHEERTLEGRAELFLFLADRAEHVEKVIKPALQEGKVVLCDRFNDSTIAYQGVARELDADFVRALCDFATGGLQPDLTFYVDVDPIVGLKRALAHSQGQDRIESEALTFHQKIREAFHSMARKESHRIRTLDGTQPSDIVLEQAIDVLYAFTTTHRQ